MMFHVKRISQSVVIIAATLLCVVLSSCIGSRPATQITDYILLENGVEENGKGLTAFVFENKIDGISVETYLNATLNTGTFSVRDFNTKINGDKFKLILYENAEIEKYFATTNLVVVNLEPQKMETVSNRKFVAISVVDSQGNDALSEKSLYYNIAVNYLKSLKDNYVSNGQ